MNNPYRDIRDRLGDPQWWDENAVPRYCAFTPEECADIYADEAALVLIECQGCGAEFRVCISSGTMALVQGYAAASALAAAGDLHYGDPPNAVCCPAGPTMNSVPRRVLEFWERKRVPYGWKRRPDLEHPIDCEWAA